MLAGHPLGNLCVDKRGCRIVGGTLVRSLGEQGGLWQEKPSWLMSLGVRRTLAHPTSRPST